MPNNRIFYAVQALGIKPGDTGSITWMKGVQSVGITTNFNLEQVFELGQLAIYENIENVAEIEVTVEKVLDGQELVYLTACSSGSTDIVAASNQTAGLYLTIYSDSKTSASGTGAVDGPVGLVYCSGMRPSNISYTIPVEGNATESVTFVGNDKVWQTGTALTGFASADYPPINAATLHSPANTVFRRQHFVNHDGSTAVIPSEVRAAVGTGKIQNVSMSVDLGRENIFELGSFRPYTKFTSFPVAVTCDFEVVALSGDYKSASGDANNLTNQEIKIKLANGTKKIEWDLGTKNKLTSINYTGGDTGGGNASITYSYQGFNAFKVSTGNV